MKNILIICGGKSAEHEVSLRSAANITAAMDKKKFNPVVVVISRTGCWYLLKECVDAPQHTLCTLMRDPDQTVLLSADHQIKIDAVFPLIHGPMGEDGTMQGLLEIMSLPYVGSGVLASAIGMDKVFMKKILAGYDIPVVPMIVATDKEFALSFDELCAALQTSVLFVKPAVMGSSVGVKKVVKYEQLAEALAQAFEYGNKVIIEKYIAGREVECAVLGNATPMASCVGEIKPLHDFYSYEAKYVDPNGAELIVPAILSDSQSEEIKSLAIRAFQAIECKGLARVDFFIAENQKVYINEINTIPGFTSISMYPKMWEASGVSYTDLISQLINLAFEEFELKQKIRVRPDTNPEQFALKLGEFKSPQTNLAKH